MSDSTPKQTRWGYIGRGQKLHAIISDDPPSYTHCGISGRLNIVSREPLEVEKCRTCSQRIKTQITS